MKSSNSIQVYLSQNLYKACQKPIRQKSDIIELLLSTLPDLMVDVSIDHGLGHFEIIIDKMSRIVYTLYNSDKIIYKRFSFTFPFYIKENTESSINKWAIFDHYGENINSQIISILTSLLEEGLFNDKISLDIDPLEFYERIFQAIDEITKDSDEVTTGSLISETLIWHFIRLLFLFEPGYLRYDFDNDVSRCNPFTHPLHHLDFYFSSNATLKIGVAKDHHDFKLWKTNSFEELLNIKTNCFYLKL